MYSHARAPAERQRHRSALRDARLGVRGRSSRGVLLFPCMAEAHLQNKVRAAAVVESRGRGGRKGGGRGGGGRMLLGFWVCTWFWLGVGGGFMILVLFCIGARL